MFQYLQRELNYILWDFSSELELGMISEELVVALMLSPSLLLFLVHVENLSFLILQLGANLLNFKFWMQIFFWLLPCTSLFLSASSILSFPKAAMRMLRQTQHSLKHSTLLSWDHNTHPFLLLSYPTKMHRMTFLSNFCTQMIRDKHVKNATKYSEVAHYWSYIP